MGVCRAMSRWTPTWMASCALAVGTPTCWELPATAPPSTQSSARTSSTTCAATPRLWPTSMPTALALTHASSSPSPHRAWAASECLSNLSFLALSTHLTSMASSPTCYIFIICRQPRKSGRPICKHPILRLILQPLMWQYSFAGTLR